MQRAASTRGLQAGRDPAERATADACAPQVGDHGAVTGYLCAEPNRCSARRDIDGAPAVRICRTGSGCDTLTYRDGASRTLEPGMVLTVEPGCYVAEDDTSVPESWRGIGIRIEDDLLLTATGHEVLTAGIPKTVEEIEAACQGRTLARVS